MRYEVRSARHYVLITAYSSTACGTGMYVQSTVMGTISNRRVRFVPHLPQHRLGNIVKSRLFVRRHTVLLREFGENLPTRLTRNGTHRQVKSTLLHT